MAKDRRRISEKDRALFRDEVGDVTPIPQDRVEHTPPRPRPLPRQRWADEKQVLQEIDLSLDYDPAEAETGDELIYAAPGVQQQVMRRLRRGHYRVEGELDLHGMTAREARDELAAFLQECLRRGLRCVRIIHGKGHGSFQKQPVLKRKVSGWLAQRVEVLAYASARPVDGGTGALYVLLRRTN